jgi:hypothetical protein
MTQVSDYLAQSSHYIDEQSSAIIEEMTDEQFRILMVATNEMLGVGEMTQSEPGIDNSLTKTNESIADFDNSRAIHWAEQGIREEMDIGIPAVKYDRIQMHKSQPRQTFMVIDFNEYRVVMRIYRYRFQ